MGRVVSAWVVVLFAVLFAQYQQAKSSRTFVVERYFANGNCSSGTPVPDAGNIYLDGVRCVKFHDNLSRRLHCEPDGIRAYFFASSNCRGDHIRNETFLECNGGDRDAVCMELDSVFQFSDNCVEFKETVSGHVGVGFCNADVRDVFGRLIGSSISRCINGSAVYELFSTADCTLNSKNYTVPVDEKFNCAEINGFQNIIAARMAQGYCVDVPDLAVVTPKPRPSCGSHSVKYEAFLIMLIFLCRMLQ